MSKGDLDKLTELSRAFRPSRMLLTACELDLFDHLEEPATATEVASILKASERGVAILLDGLAALGLIHKEGGRYRNGQAVSTYLVSGKPQWRGAIFKHMANCWHGWNNLTRTVKSGHSGVDEHRWERGERRSFILGMHAVARGLAPQLAARLPLPEQGRLLDVGGGPATYCMAFCRRWPQLTCTLFDLPATVRIAREVLAADGQDVAARIRLRRGDFTTDTLGASQFDFVWMSQILHSYPEEVCAATVAKAFEALKPGGVAAIHEFALNEARTAPLAAAIFSVHMLAVTPGGRAYGREEIAGWMRQAGFGRVRTRRASANTTLILGWKRP